MSEQADTVRAEIEAALHARRAGHEMTNDQILAAVLPVVEAQRLAARREERDLWIDAIRRDTKIGTDALAATDRSAHWRATWQGRIAGHDQVLADLGVLGAAEASRSAILRPATEVQHEGGEADPSTRRPPHPGDAAEAGQ